MVDDPSDLSPGDEDLDLTPAGSTPQRVGAFRHHFDDQRWEWSPQVAQMHGYDPGTVTPTTELILSHKHPDDYAQVAAALEESRRTHQSWSTRHRIVDTRGRIHHVVVVGAQLRDDTGEVIGMDGFYIDLTPADDRAHEDRVTAAVAEITENRGVIERTKGMLMVVYRIDEAAAFELLKWRSQQSNVKLRLLAEQIAADFLAMDYTDGMPARAVYDQLLLTAHQRVGLEPDESIGDDRAS